MSKSKAMNKRKSVTAIVAVVMTVLIVFGGTFAWQSIQQEALNEVAATVNPGGRLHDDFVEITEEGDYDTMTYNKDIYVENYTSRTNNGVQIFARVRLDEYMEFGKGAGTENSSAKPLIDGATLDNRTSWATIHWDQEKNEPVESLFSKYWEYDWGNTENEKINYMPTFNLDNTSLDPDVNGAVYFDKDGNRVEVPYTDYSGQLGNAVTTKEAEEIYTPNADGTPNEKNNTTTHIVEQTGTATVISMKQWIENGMEMGDFWVYDEDGWAYYAKPIDPDFATGLLMTGIKRKDNIINEDWYYAINVVAQFITKDDLGDGSEENPGFNRNGEKPSPSALQLLNKIGVDVTFEVGSEKELTDALAHGGNIVLTDNISITAPLTVSVDTTLDLGKYTISNTTKIWDDTSDPEKWSLISVQGAGTTLTIDGGYFKALENDCFAVDVRDGARVVINDGTFVGNISAVYVHEGTALINGGNFSIQQKAEGATNEYNQMINAYNANRKDGKAKITICGGTFEGFNPTEADDGNLVPANYEMTKSDEGDVYTVAKIGASTGEETDEGEANE